MLALMKATSAEPAPEPEADAAPAPPPLVQPAPVDLPNPVAPHKEAVSQKMALMFATPAESLQGVFDVFFELIHKQHETMVEMKTELNQLKADVPNSINKLTHDCTMLSQQMQTLEYNLLGQDDEEEEPAPEPEPEPEPEPAEDGDAVAGEANGYG